MTHPDYTPYEPPLWKKVVFVIACGLAGLSFAVPFAAAAIAKSMCQLGLEAPVIMGLPVLLPWCG